MQCLTALFAIEEANRSADTITGFAPSGWRNVVTQGQRLTLMDLGAISGSDTDEGSRSGGGSGHDEADRSVAVEYSFDGRSATGASSTGDGYGMKGSRRGVILVGPVPQPDAEGVLAEDTRRVGEVVVQLIKLIDSGHHGSVERHVNGPPGPRWEARSIWQVELDGVSQTLEAILTAGSGDPTVRVRGATGRSEWRAAERFADHDEAEAATGPVSPLPGSVVSVHVAPGDTVADGELLVVIEAMKMEHRIIARSEVTIAEVRVAVGDKVDAGEVLVTFGD
jgi:propionyl-CoA carboxylase alpha chain